jgi:hypothetical protein
MTHPDQPAALLAYHDPALVQVALPHPRLRPLVHPPVGPRGAHRSRAPRLDRHLAGRARAGPIPPGGQSGIRRRLILAVLLVLTSRFMVDDLQDLDEPEHRPQPA